MHTEIRPNRNPVVQIDWSGKSDFLANTHIYKIEWVVITSWECYFGNWMMVDVTHCTVTAKKILVTEDRQ